jgi:hypothetical protein
MLGDRPAVPEETRTKMRRGMKIYLIASAVVLASAVGYLAWILDSRLRSERELEQKAAAERREGDRRTVDMLGGNRFDILNFYASPPVIRRGDSVQLCYGVSNAKEVRLEPKPDAGVWPSFSRCITVSPKKTTAYTLTAEDASGNTKAVTLEVKVQ